jgi:Raf kinase inhibitor-like YbhB/YbcL family protein
VNKRRLSSLLRQSLCANRRTPLLVGAVFLVVAAGCNRGGNEPLAPLSMQLASARIAAGELSKAITCDGAGLSPQLTWSEPPPQTRSLALVVTDRDSPLGYNFVHWVIYNISPSTRELPAEIPAQNTLPDGVEQGPNDSNKPGYTPPCPKGKSHRYDFILYALDTRVNLPSATKKQLLSAVSGHVLARGELVGRYGR